MINNRSLLSILVLVVNQTSDTLQSLTLELATLGDLKLTEKPSVQTVGPHDFCSIKANVKVLTLASRILGHLVSLDVQSRFLSFCLLIVHHVFLFVGLLH